MLDRMETVGTIYILQDGEDHQACHFMAIHEAIHELNKFPSRGYIRKTGKEMSVEKNLKKNLIRCGGKREGKN